MPLDWSSAYPLASMGSAFMRFRLFFIFIVHCARRAFSVQRAMGSGVSFEHMTGCLSPLSGCVPLQERELPEVCITRASHFCAYLFPKVWRRRCLFRSLLVLDWAHRSGIDPTLNVGMRLDSLGEQGHCWLSIGGRPFCESGGWPGRYDTLMHREKGLQYWVAVVPEPCGQNRRTATAKRQRGERV